MRCAKEHQLRTIALSCVYTERKSYPREDAAHIAIRTVRRFLEHFNEDFDHVIFCIDDDADMEIYEQVLPLYCPRSCVEEQTATEQLPEDTGNAMGETIIEERTIRNSSLPVSDASAAGGPSHSSRGRATRTDSDSLRLREEKTVVAPTRRFDQMDDDPDAERRARVDAAYENMDDDARATLRYETYLRQARNSDLSDIAALNLIYTSGTDLQGRQVLMVLGSHLPAETVDLERVLLYIIRVMDRLVNRPYVLIYIHSEFSSENRPELSWLREMFDIFDRKYRANLKAMYVVHSSFWVKLVFWALTPVLTTKFWDTLVYIDRVQDLNNYFDRGQMQIPAHVIDFDREANPECYRDQNNPEGRNTNALL
jgi:hypothetical protein